MNRDFSGSTNSNGGKHHLPTEKTLFARIMLQARPYWLHLLGVSLLSILAMPISLLVPLPLKIAVDSAIGSHPLLPFLASLMPEGAARSSTSIMPLVAALLIAFSLPSQLEDRLGSVMGTY